MVRYTEILRLHEMGYPRREICEICHCSSKTCTKIVHASKARGIHYSKSDSDESLKAKLFPEDECKGPKGPDIEKIRADLNRSSVSKKQLWQDYKKETEQNGYTACCYAKFCRDVAAAEYQHRATTDRRLKPALQMIYFTLPSPVSIVDASTGEVSLAYVFVAYLPYSAFAYAHAAILYKQSLWVELIASELTKCIHYFSGVTKEVAISEEMVSWPRYELPDSLRQLADYYGVTIRQKNGMDSIDLNQDLSKACDAIFTSLGELQAMLFCTSDNYNKRPLTNGKSPSELFQAEEKLYLEPVPNDVFETVMEKDAKVQYDLHVAYQKHYYSVPWYLYGKTVNLKISSSKIMIYYEGKLVAQHPHLTGEKVYHTQAEHMPTEEQERNLPWNRARFLKWGNQFGPNTFCVIEKMLKQGSYVQTRFRACRGVLSLDSTRLEQACEIILRNQTPCTYHNVLEQVKRLQ